MKKILFILALFAFTFCQSQIIVNEPTNYKGITLQSCYVHVVVTAVARYKIDSTGQITGIDSTGQITGIDSTGQITGIDTVVTLTGWQYPSINDYVREMRNDGSSGAPALQVSQLIDHISYDKGQGIGYYLHYKLFMLAKNPSWDENKITILQ